MKFIQVKLKVYNLALIYSIDDVHKHTFTADVMKYGFYLDTLTGQRIFVDGVDKRDAFIKYNKLIQFLSNDEKFLNLDAV